MYSKNNISGYILSNFESRFQRSTFNQYSGQTRTENRPEIFGVSYCRNENKFVLVETSRSIFILELNSILFEVSSFCSQYGQSRY